MTRNNQAKKIEEIKTINKTKMKIENIKPYEKNVFISL
jgi:hypothetical protein